MLAGYGSIYCDTWFGDYRNIEHSIPNAPDCTYYQYAQGFVDRVEADGGTLESVRCVAGELQFLKDN